MTQEEKIKRVFDNALFNDRAQVEPTSEPGEYAVNLGDWLVTFDQLDAIRESLDLVYISGVKPYNLTIIVKPRPE